MKRVLLAAAGGVVLTGSLYLRQARKRRCATATGTRRELIAKLCRELAQSERSAIAHPRREAKRLGDTPPARALRDIADHAEQLRPRFDALVIGRVTPRTGVELGRWIGELFSLVRTAALDHLIDSERSYRGTLLGVDHGTDIVRLLAAAATEQGDEPLLAFCNDWLAGRIVLLNNARAAMAWFAREPETALQSG